MSIPNSLAMVTQCCTTLIHLASSERKFLFFSSWVPSTLPHLTLSFIYLYYKVYLVNKSLYIPSYKMEHRCCEKLCLGLANLSFLTLF